MKTKAIQPAIQTRDQLYRFLQEQMCCTYQEVKENKKLSNENTLVKSYVFEVDLPRSVEIADNRNQALKAFLTKVFCTHNKMMTTLSVLEKEEKGFFEICSQELRFFIDATTNKRFWYGFSVSTSVALDRWFEMIVRSHVSLDNIWIWPEFLEKIQSEGEPRGFGLDYDFRKFEDTDSDSTTYLKMQLWGGADTAEVYQLLKSSSMSSKTVLSKIRLKRYSEFTDDKSSFALQEVRYNGKFSAKGTDFGLHVATMQSVRRRYEEKITSIEKNYSLKWMEKSKGDLILDGYALHFIPQQFELPVTKFCEKVFDGTAPFRLMGLAMDIGNHGMVVDAVDLHTGGELSIEVYPDIITVYLPEKTCGNSIARLFTNLQHYFNTGFIVEADNGDRIF